MSDTLERGESFSSYHDVSTLHWHGKRSTSHTRTSRLGDEGCPRDEGTRRSGQEGANQSNKVHHFTAVVHVGVCDLMIDFVHTSKCDNEESLSVAKIPKCEAKTSGFRLVRLRFCPPYDNAPLRTARKHCPAHNLFLIISPSNLRPKEYHSHDGHAWTACNLFNWIVGITRIASKPLFIHTYCSFVAFLLKSCRSELFVFGWS